MLAWLGILVSLIWKYCLHISNLLRFLWFGLNCLGYFMCSKIEWQWHHSHTETANYGWGFYMREPIHLYCDTDNTQTYIHVQANVWTDTIAPFTRHPLCVRICMQWEMGRGIRLSLKLVREYWFMTPAIPNLCFRQYKAQSTGIQIFRRK